MSGMTVAPLAFEAGEIAAYATATHLEVEEAMYFIDRLDMEWLAWADAGAKKLRAQSKAKSERAGP